MYIYKHIQECSLQIVRLIIIKKKAKNEDNQYLVHSYHIASHSR